MSVVEETLSTCFHDIIELSRQPPQHEMVVAVAP
jgi:hypothetical protein